MVPLTAFFDLLQAAPAALVDDVVTKIEMVANWQHKGGCVEIFWRSHAGAGESCWAVKALASDHPEGVPYNERTGEFMPTLCEHADEKTVRRFALLQLHKPDVSQYKPRELPVYGTSREDFKAALEAGQKLLLFGEPATMEMWDNPTEDMILTCRLTSCLDAHSRVLQQSLEQVTRRIQEGKSTFLDEALRRALQAEMAWRTNPPDKAPMQEVDPEKVTCKDVIKARDAGQTLYIKRAGSDLILCPHMWTMATALCLVDDFIKQLAGQSERVLQESRSQHTHYVIRRTLMESSRNSAAMILLAKMKREK